MIEYEAEIEVEMAGSIEGYRNGIGTVFDAIQDREEMLDAVMSGSFDDMTLSLSYNVRTNGPQAAIMAGRTALDEALSLVNAKAGPLIAMEAKPYTDEDDNELVSQAEIARRIKKSREWIRQLVRKKGFPSPAQATGSRGGLFRWGDIAAWKERQGN